MYAIVRDRSRCLTLRPGDELLVDRLPGLEPGAELVFDQVSLLKQEDGSVLLGSPAIAGAEVRAEVLGEVKDRKLVIQHFRRRQNSRTRTGHRQSYTRIRVKEIQTPAAQA